MSGTILEDIMDLINSEREGLGLPAAYLDYLGVGRQDGALSVQSIASAKVVKQYIDGSGEYQVSFRISFRKKAGTASSAVPLEQIEALEALSALFSGMNDFRLGSGRIVRRAEATAPSIIDRDDQGNTAYGVSVTLIYAEGE